MKVEILKTWSRYNFGFPSRPNFTLKNTKSNMFRVSAEQALCRDKKFKNEYSYFRSIPRSCQTFFFENLS